MADGLLVSFAGFPLAISSLFPDNGLASLAGTLRAHGHRVRVLDYNTVGIARRLVPVEQSAGLAGLARLAPEPGPEVVRELLELDARLEEGMARLTAELVEELAGEVSRGVHFVGFKLWSGHGYLAAVTLAAGLRRRFPALKLYGGGPAVLYAGEAIFEDTRAFDALVEGEGELACLGLAAHAEGRGALEDVPNLILPGGRRTPHRLVAALDELPPPAYDLESYPSLAGDEQIKVFVLDESRGCPMGCAFCIHQQASGSSWRVKTAERVLEEVARLGDRFGAATFRMGGSFTPPRLFRELLDRAGRSGRRLRFSGFAYPQGMTGDHLDALAAGGCVSLFLGVESFDERDSAALGKRLHPRRALEVIRGCQERGIVPGISLIVPLPGQSEASREHNRRMVLDLAGAGPLTVMVTFPALLPHTRWWAERERFGITLAIDEATYRRRLAAYKIRIAIPPPLWEPMPYLVDGLDFAALTRVCGEFQRSLGASGVVLNLQDEAVLLADALGQPLVALRARLQQVFLTLDFAMLAELVQEVNGRLAMVPRSTES